MKKNIDKHLVKALAIVMSVSMFLYPTVALATEGESPVAGFQTVVQSEAEAVTIEEEETAKAAKADTKKISSDWWILVLAAATGLTVEEYLRRKNSKVKAD